MSHSRPGTLSLSIGTNDDDPGIRQRPGYRNTEFVITTGIAKAMAVPAYAWQMGVPLPHCFQDLNVLSSLHMYTVSPHHHSILCHADDNMRKTMPFICAIL